MLIGLIIALVAPPGYSDQAAVRHSEDKKARLDSVVQIILE